MAWVGKCAECKEYFGEHTKDEAMQCLRKLSKKVDEGLVAIPYPYDKAYRNADT